MYFCDIDEMFKNTFFTKQLQETTFEPALGNALRPATLLKRDSNTAVFLSNL